MPTAGGVTCDIINGQSRAPAERVESWNVVGRDGYAAQRVGKGQSEFVFILVKFAVDNAAGETWYGQVLALQGSKISVTDGFNVTHTNLLVETVEFSRRSVAVPLGLRYEALLRGVVMS